MGAVDLSKVRVRPSGLAAIAERVELGPKVTPDVAAAARRSLGQFLIDTGRVRDRWEADRRAVLEADFAADPATIERALLEARSEIDAQIDAQAESLFYALG